MARIVLLDAGPLGLLGIAEEHSPGGECRRWLQLLAETGVEIKAPDIALYEARRELRRLKATSQIARLERMLVGIDQIPVTSEAWRRAEDFWALVRRAGQPTAPDDDLDGDAILAGVAATSSSATDELLIATTNARHFGRFPVVVAREWRSIR